MSLILSRDTAKSSTSCVGEVIAQLLMVSGAAKHCKASLAKLIDIPRGCEISQEYDAAMLSLHMLVSVANRAEITLFNYVPNRVTGFFLNWFFTFQKTRVNKLTSVAIKLQRMLIPMSIGQPLTVAQLEEFQQHIRDLKSSI